jgi:hypothetical protein
MFFYKFSNFGAFYSFKIFSLIGIFTISFSKDNLDGSLPKSFHAISIKLLAKFSTSIPLLALIIPP